MNATLLSAFFLSAPVWTVQVDPLTTALGFVHVQVERALGEHLSVYAGPSLRLFPGLRGKADETMKGYGAEVGVRYFFRPTAPTGWWAQVRGVGAQLVDGDDTGLGGYASALGGYTAVFDGWFVLAGGLGINYLNYTLNGQGTEGVLPAAHSTVGVAW
jgi:hypothetical protein